MKIFHEIDLETLGTAPNAPIIAIGVATFNEKEGVTSTFYRTIDFNSACRGRTLDPETVLWWMKQSDEARGALTNPPVPTVSMHQAIDEFNAYMLKVGTKKDNVVWGNGATFDITMLEDLYRGYNAEPPWIFWNVRCHRTVKSLFKYDFPREGTHHNALDDAVYQAGQLLHICKEAGFHLA